MDVGAERGGGVAMTQAVGHQVDRHGVVQHQRCRGVSETVQTYGWQLELAGEGLKAPCQPVGTNGLTPAVGEHRVCRPGVTKPRSLALVVVLQQRGDGVVQLDAPVGSGGLAEALDGLATDAGDGLAYFDGAGRQVHVDPGEADQFGASHAGGQRKRPEGGEVVTLGPGEELVGLRGCPDVAGCHASLCGAALGRLCEVGGVPADVAVADGVLERGSKGAVDQLDRLGDEALVLVGPAVVVGGR